MVLSEFCPHIGAFIKNKFRVFMPSKIKFKQSTLSHSMHLILKCRVYLNLFVAAYY